MAADIRDNYGVALMEMAEEDERIVAMVTDAKGSSKLQEFEKRFPDRFFDVGICEQHLVGMAAGLAISGKIPFISALACFITMRCYEQVRTTLGYPKLNVKITAMSSGFAYPQLGATHTCLEDLSIMRAASNISVIYPSDSREVYQATKAMAKIQGPVFMRLGRQLVRDIYDDSYRFVFGKGSLLREGTDVAIIAVGPAVPIALDAREELKKEGIRARVINLSTIKPLDEEILAAAARETGAIVTVEEHNVAGGMGSTVAEFVAQDHPVPMRLLGVPNETPDIQPRDVLLARYGISVPGIAKAVRDILRPKP